MKIRIGKNDIANVLRTFCPDAKCDDGRFEFSLGGKKVSVGDTELALKSSVAYDTVSGDLDLKIDQDGVDADFEFDGRSLS